MIFDSHMHSSFSTDSQMEIEEIIEKANELSIGCCITDHHDLAYPINDQFKLNFDEYLNNYSKYRSNNLLIGVEFGINPTINNKLTSIAQNYNLDYIIGSIHDVNSDDIYTSYKNVKLPKDEFFRNYLEYMYNTIKSFNDFDALGHIDYLCRYANYTNSHLIYDEHSDLFDDIFKCLIEKNKVLELNTARLSDKESFNNLINIYKRYQQLGGKYITIGSDSHTKDAIGRNFKEAFDFLEITNLKGIYFKERQPQYF